MWYLILGLPSKIYISSWGASEDFCQVIVDYNEFIGLDDVGALFPPLE